MSIRPVDLQLMVQKSAEVHKMNNNEANRPDVAQQRFAEKLQKEVQHQDQDVTQTNKTEEQSVNKDGKGPGGGGGKGGKKKNNEEGKKGEQKISSASMFDITV